MFSFKTSTKRKRNAPEKTRNILVYTGFYKSIPRLNLICFIYSNLCHVTHLPCDHVDKTTANPVFLYSSAIFSKIGEFSAFNLVLIVIRWVIYKTNFSNFNMRVVSLVKGIFLMKWCLFLQLNHAEYVEATLSDFCSLGELSYYWSFSSDLYLFSLKMHGLYK